ncbi:hypothetical protein LINGRAHAP2_LOCUS22645 [Linum grandiflorum]
MHSGIGKNQNSMIEWHDHSPSAVGDEQVKEKGGKVVPKTETEDARVDNEKVIVVRTRCSPTRIMELVALETTTPLKLEELGAIGFDGTTKLQI